MSALSKWLAGAKARLGELQRLESAPGIRASDYYQTKGDLAKALRMLEASHKTLQTIAKRPAPSPQALQFVADSCLEAIDAIAREAEP